MSSNHRPNLDDVYAINHGVYKETAIYGRSTDGKGHKESKRVQFPPSLLHAVNVHYKDLGYDTPESFIRDAVVHRLHFWAEQDGVPLEVEAMMAAIRIESLLEDQAAWMKELDRARQGLANSSPSVRSLILEQVRVMRDHLPDHLTEINHELGHLLKSYE